MWRGAIAHAVSRRPSPRRLRIRSQARPCEICGGQSGTGISFSLHTAVFFPIIITPLVSHTRSSTRYFYQKDKGRRLGAFQKAVLFRNRGAFDRKVLGIFFFSVWRLTEIPATRQTASTRVHLNFYPLLKTRVDEHSRSMLQYKTIKHVGCKMADNKLGKLFTSKSLQMTRPLAWYCGRKMRVPESWPIDTLIAKAASQTASHPHFNSVAGVHFQSIPRTVCDRRNGYGPDLSARALVFYWSWNPGIEDNQPGPIRRTREEVFI